MAGPERVTPDLDSYPDLVMVLLGMRVRRLAGLRTLLGFGPRIEASAAAGPDGLLHHEVFLWSLRPPHIGIRQYWRDLESLERWTRSDPHRDWWLGFMRDTGGTGVWHEAYFMGGGIDAIYADAGAPVGLGTFAALRPARGRMFSSRDRAGHSRAVDGTPPPVVAETELYDVPTP